MEFVLENKCVSAKFRDFGGELTEFVVDGVNYIWNGNEKFWKFHAPILFPVVCRLSHNRYLYTDHTFEMPSHGFGRTSTYRVIEKSSESITFNLKYSDTTLKSYPFKFDLKIKYILLEKGLEIYYTVENVDQKTMYFSIGGHTAFMCPFAEGETHNDYYFELSEKETAERLVCDRSGLLHIRKPFLNNDNIIEINERQLLNDTIIFDSLKSTKVNLKSRKSNKYVEFDFTGFPYLAFWSSTKDAPFVCIEPWFGLPDEADTDGDITGKLGIMNLKPGRSFECLQIFNIKEI